MNLPLAVAKQFKLPGKIVAIQEFGSGNINDTYLVSTDSLKKNRIILQRINHKVFSRPQDVVENMRTLIEHVVSKQKHDRPISLKNWQLPEMISSKKGRDWVIDAQNSFWRAISYIENSISYENITCVKQAKEVGCALGRFHNFTSDLETQKLHDTLPGFHVTPLYLERFDEIQNRVKPQPPSNELEYCLRFVASRREFADTLDQARQLNLLQVRTIHGDPKASNVMFDKDTNRAISLIDLDTLKPGLIQFDIGDCLRSGCNPAGEEAINHEDIHFNVDFCQAILDGYFTYTAEFLQPKDYSFIYDSICLMTFELGLRFLTDFLEGNIYFKAKHRNHNLRRALNQFKLAESIESQETDIKAIVNSFQN